MKNVNGVRNNRLPRPSTNPDPEVFTRQIACSGTRRLQDRLSCSRSKSGNFGNDFPVRVGTRVENLVFRLNCQGKSASVLSMARVHFGFAGEHGGLMAIYRRYRLGKWCRRARGTGRTLNAPLPYTVRRQRGSFGAVAASIRNA